MADGRWPMTDGRWRARLPIEAEPGLHAARDGSVQRAADGVVVPRQLDWRVRRRCQLEIRELQPAGGRQDDDRLIAADEAAPRELRDRRERDAGLRTGEEPFQVGPRR